MKKDVCVIGLGTFGYELAVQLTRMGHHVLAIDLDEKIVNSIKDDVTVAVQADVTDPDVIRKLEIHRFDRIIFGMSSALEAIVLGITHLKNMGAKNIIGKANTQIQKEVLLKIGADEVILPEIASAQRLAERITYPNVLDKFSIGDDLVVMEMKVPGSFIGKSPVEMDLRKKYGINIIMLKRSDQARFLTDPHTRFAEGDVVVVAGKEQSLKKIM